MANNTLRKIFLIACLLLTLTVHATVYTWSQYDLTFETPEGGFVTYSSNTRFEIQWDEMVMTVQLYSKEKDDEKKIIKENLHRKALDYSMFDLSDTKVKVKGFKSYALQGTMPDGTRAIIADLVSKKQNLIIEVTVNYLYGNREMVDDMIESFTEGKKTEAREKKPQRVQSKEDAEKQLQEQEKERQLQRDRNAGKLHDA